MIAQQLLTRASGIEYFERVLPGDYSETWTTDGCAQTTRTFYVPGADNTPLNFARDMIGFSSYSLGQIHRQLPERDPAYNELYCTSLECIGEGFADNQSTKAAEYKIHIYRACFRSLPYRIREDGDDGGNANAPELARFVERAQQFRVESFGLPGNTSKWVSDQKPILESLPKLAYSAEITYIWHRVPFRPDSAIIACLGRVNVADFDTAAPDGLNLKAQTLLLVGAEVTRIPSPVGFVFHKPEYMIKYTFAHRDQGAAAGGVRAGWNHLYRHSTGTYDLHTRDGTAGGTRLYEAIDFDQLFLVP